MTVEIKSKLEAHLAMLDDTQKAQVLLRLSYQLTITGREVYYRELPEPVQVKVLRDLNEMQHQISQQAGHYLAHRTERWSDDAFVAILESHAERGGFAQGYQRAVEHILSTAGPEEPDEQAHGQA